MAALPADFGLVCGRRKWILERSTDRWWQAAGSRQALNHRHKVGGEQVANLFPAETQTDLCITTRASAAGSRGSSEPHHIPEFGSRSKPIRELTLPARPLIRKIPVAFILRLTSLCDLAHQPRKAGCAILDASKTSCVKDCATILF